MTIWMKFGRLLPRNQEGKWPLPVQLLVFVLFEALFIYGKYQANYLVYNPTMYNWALDTFGMMHSDHVLTLLSMLISAEVCAWHIGLQRYITFGGQTLRRWTILPIALGYLALNLVIWLLGQLLLTVELPLLTDNMMVYTVIHSVLYVGIVVVFCALVHALRFGNKSRAGALAAAEIALVLLLTLCSACSGQIQQNMLAEVYAAPTSQQVTVTHIGVSEGEITDDLFAAFLSSSGLNPDDVVIVSPENVNPEDVATTDLAGLLSGLAASADPFAAYEEAMKPSNLVGDILMWVQLIPIFFGMKHWLFCPDTPKEANACNSALNSGGSSNSCSSRQR